MSTSVVAIEVQRYLEGVRARLDDLPEDEREELLEDLEEHLREVAAEDEGSLEERLGPPEEYADELRISAGLGPREARSMTRMIDRFVRSRSVRSFATLIESRQARVARAFLRELGPGWWVLRGYIAVLLVAIVSGRNEGNLARESIPMPFLFGSYVWGAIALALAIVISVLIGRRALSDRRVGFVSLAVTGIVLASAFTWVGDLSAVGYAYADDSSRYETPYLHHPDGVAIANICPYSADGKLLSGVLLFDQGGRAIINTADLVDGVGGVERQQPAILNAYPLSIRVPDRNFVMQPLTCPASVAAQPTSPLTPASSPSVIP